MMHIYLIYIILFLFPFTILASDDLTFDEEKYIEENQTLSVAMLSEPWFPYADISMSGEYKGIYVDYIKDLFVGKGISIVFNRFDTVEKILKSVNEGSSDIALGYSPSEKRKALFLFSKPLFESSIAVWYRNKKVTALPNHKMSWTCVSGTIYCDELKKNGAINVHEVESFFKSVELVNSGVVDAMISNYVTISEYLSENKITEGIVRIPDWLGLEKPSIIMSKNNTILKSIINKLMSENKINNNKLADIYHKNDWNNIEFRKLKKENKTIKYSFYENREPLFYRNEDGKLTGYLYDFIELMERRTGLDFEYVPVNQENIWDMFSAGKIDLIPLAYSDSSNTPGLELSNPYISITYVSIENKTSSNRDKERIGVLVSQNNESLNLVRQDITKESFVYTDIQELIHDISNDEIDVAYISKDLIHGIITSDIDDKFIIGARDDRIFNVSFAISSGHESLLNLINSTLRIIDKEEFRKIKRSYRKFNVVYGYEKEIVLKLILVLFVFLVLSSFLIYFWLTNLNLKIKVKEKDNVNVKGEKAWLQSVIFELPSIIFIHNKDKKTLLSNCTWYNDGMCDKCNYYSNLNSDISDNIILDDVVVSDEISIKDCKFNYTYLNRVRKRIYEERTNTYYLLTVINDISQQKNQEEALIEANNKTQKALVYREQFLASMSHELRTPIAGITGLLELLSKKIKDGEKQSLLNNISGSMNHLHMLVNDILDYSKLEAEQLSLDKRDCYYLNTLNELFRLHHASANDKGLNVYITIQPSLIEVISVDSLRLSQIINNLISNAIKFTNKGHIEVIVSIIDGYLNVNISDTGIGISEENLLNIFKPFTQADNSIAREYGGTGLGLNIVNELIKLMDGTLNIKSVENIGTSVDFSIPITIISEFDKPVNELSITSEINDDNLHQWLDIFSGNYSNIINDVVITSNITEEQSSKYKDIICLTKIDDNKKSVNLNHHYINGNPIFLDQLLNSLNYIKNGKGSFEPIYLHPLNGTVLISEDNRINQELLVSQLYEIGIKSVVTSNGKEAWEKIKKDANKFDLLITDCHMPIINGFELSKKIRKELPEFSNKAIIGCTAEDSRSIRINSELCGFDDVLFKPYGLKQLYDMLSKHLVNNDKRKLESDFLNIHKKGLMPIFIESITDDYNNFVSSTDKELDVSILHKMKGGFSSVNLLQLVSMLDSLSNELYGTKSYHDKKEVLILTIKNILINASNWYESHNE